MQQAIFGGGCFWCTESVFLHVNGVEQVESGYAGGARANPSYEQICTGATGHAEVIRISYDEKKQCAKKRWLSVTYAFGRLLFVAQYDCIRVQICKH